ncbi:MAG: hypothetical protein ACK4Z0_05780 [Sphingomonadaceae bacterium]
MTPARRTRTAQRYRGLSEAERRAIEAERVDCLCWIGTAIAAALMMAHIAGIGL